MATANNKRRANTKRVYTEAEKQAMIEQVAKYDGDTGKAARATGINRRTLDRWWKSLSELQAAEYLDEAKRKQELYWQAMEHACLEVARAKIQDMSARDALIGAGISFDKLQLLRGQATDITGTISSDAESLAREVEGILGKVMDKSASEVYGGKDD